MVARVGGVGHAGEVGGEHHGNRHQRQGIGGVAAQVGADALLFRHIAFTTRSSKLATMRRPGSATTNSASVHAPSTRRPSHARSPGRRSKLQPLYLASAAASAMNSP